MSNFLDQFLTPYRPSYLKQNLPQSYAQPLFVDRGETISQAPRESFYQKKRSYIQDFLAKYLPIQTVREQAEQDPVSVQAGRQAQEQWFESQLIAKQGGYMPISSDVQKIASEKNRKMQEMIAGGVIGANEPLNIIPKFKNIGNLSTKILGKLEGKSSVLKQFISDLTNSPDVKQVEKDLIRKVLNDYKGNIPV